MNIQKELQEVSKKLKEIRGVNSEELSNLLKIETELARRESTIRKMKMLILSAPITKTDIKSISRHYKLLMSILFVFSQKNEEMIKRTSDTRKILDAFSKTTKSYQISEENQYQNDVLKLINDYSRVWYAEREQTFPLLRTADLITKQIAERSR